MKILFITDECFIKSGGGTYTRALIEVFENIVGRSDFMVYFPYKTNENQNWRLNNVIIPAYRKPGILDKIRSLSCGMPTGFSKRSINDVIRIINEERFDYIVLGRSFYGGIAKLIKRNNSEIKIITFYHDVIDEVIKERFKKENTKDFLKNSPRLLSNYINEHISLKHSDKKIVLNHRDRKLYVQNYHEEPDAIIPIFSKDSFKRECVWQTDFQRCNLIFVGSYYWPNIIGITWFVENVMSQLDDSYTLYVIGRDMEKIKRQLESGRNNVKVIGTVDNLDEWYYKADIVVGPIFDGIGMKTKTVEAFMYGKIYLGTTEAFCGFVQIEDYICNSAEEFICSIRKYSKLRGRERFSEYFRKIYAENYSEEIIEQKIRKVLELH